MTLRPYCTFTLGGLLIGVDVEHVQEVVCNRRVTPVPLAPPSVVGLLNLSGQVVTVIDGRRRLGLHEAAARQEGVHVIMRHGREAVSLVVDAMPDIVDVDPDRLEPITDVVPQAIRYLFVGTYPLASGPLLGLDADRALAVSGT